MTEEFETTPDQLVQLASFGDVASAQEHALVVLAMGLPCWVWAHDASFSLHVLPENAPAIHDELRTYAREQHELAQQRQPWLPLPQHAPGGTLYLVWALITTLVFALQQRIPGLTDLASSANTAIIDHHQWWRPFTALFLHGDGGHLLGNLLSGLLFMLLVARSVGPWRGWLSVLACGTLGNLATAIHTYPTPSASIGASTAVFAALGMLSGVGLSLMLRHRLQLPWLRILSPVLGGIIILGMLGTGHPGDNTDVMGHVFGFCAGAIYGLLHGLLQHPSAMHRAAEP